MGGGTGNDKRYFSQRWNFGSGKKTRRKLRRELEKSLKDESFFRIPFSKKWRQNFSRDGARVEISTGEACMIMGGVRRLYVKLYGELSSSWDDARNAINEIAESNREYLFVKRPVYFDKSF